MSTPLWTPALAGLALTGCTLLLVACADRGAKPDPPPGLSGKQAAAEQARIGDELAAQLEAMGYVKPGKPQAAAARYSKEKLDAVLEGFDCTFVLNDVSRGLEVRHNAERAAKRYSPCSTFKIPNTLIGLETGVATGPEMVIPWNAKKHPKQPFWDELLKPNGIDWARDHTLETAFAQSVVWYYRELAKRIGDQRMAKHLDAFNYGNMDTSAGIDLFWLSASLEISADEQVVFLRKLAELELELEPTTYRAAMKVFEVEKTDAYTLYAKTGSGNDRSENGLGWYVGIVTRGDEVFTFAFNITADSETIWKRRIPLARRALTALGIIDGTAPK